MLVRVIIVVHEWWLVGLVGWRGRGRGCVIIVIFLVVDYVCWGNIDFATSLPLSKRAPVTSSSIVMVKELIMFAPCPASSITL